MEAAMWYDIDENLNVTPRASGRWLAGFKTAETEHLWSVGYTEVGEVKISTVFLYLDHSRRDDGLPILFETMIFNDKTRKFEDYTVRYSNWAEAEKGHRNAVDMVKKSRKITVHKDLPRFGKETNNG